MSPYLFKVAFSGVYANMRMVHVLTSVVVSSNAVICKVIKMLVCAAVFCKCFFILSASLPKLNQFSHTDICFVLHHSTGKQM